MSSALDEARRPTRDNDEISLLDVLIVLAKHKKLIFGFPLIVAVITAGITLLLPSIYTATARILPPQQNASAATALLAQFGGAIGGFGSSALGIKNPSDLYVGMLESRTVADVLIDRFDLKEVYKEDTYVETREKLDEVSDISAGKDGIISISVDDEDPKRAAEMANAYVAQLDKLTQSLALTDAGQRRLFYERELKSTKEALAKAELELSKTQETTGLIQPDAQAQAIIAAIANLRARVIQREAEIAAMGGFATPQNPDYVNAKNELASLQKQLSAMQKQHNVSIEGDVMVPTGNIPQAGLDYVRKAREVKYQEELFGLLAKQYELAKLEEGKDAAIIQIVDRAVPPDRKSKPKRALITVLVTFVAGFLAVVWAFIREERERAESDPGQSERMQALRSYLKLR